MIRDPGSDRTEAGRLRRLIESHVLADRGREGAMLGDLESARDAWEQVEAAYASGPYADMRGASVVG